MSTTYTPNGATSSETFLVPSDGDPVVAASVRPAFQAIADRLKRLADATTAAQVTSVLEWVFSPSSATSAAINATGPTGLPAVSATGGSGSTAAVVATGGASNGGGVSASTTGTAPTVSAASGGTGTAVQGVANGGGYAAAFQAVGGPAAVFGSADIGHGVVGINSNTVALPGLPTGRHGVVGYSPSGIANAGIYGYSDSDAPAVRGRANGSGTSVYADGSSTSGYALQVAPNLSSPAMHFIPEVTGAPPAGIGGDMHCTTDGAGNFFLHFHVGNGGWVQVAP